jgi:DNA-binding LacI/PurR family transcriptional regulator
MSMPLKKRATIRDVAEKAGVSKSLVALAYSSPSSVSNYRRAKIQSAADDLGFVPNIIASALAAQQSKIIGILVGDLHNPLFMDIAELVRVALEAQGQTIFMTSAAKRDMHNQIISDSDALRNLYSLPMDSLLIIGTIPDSKELQDLSTRTRVVFATAVNNPGVKASVIRVDEAAAMLELVTHLKSLGHRRIGYISWDKRGVAELREVAFFSAMDALGLSKGVSHVQTPDATEQGGYTSAREILNLAAPTAVIAFNDLMALGVQKYIYENNHKEIAVTGFDNTFVAALHQVSLTSIDQGNLEIAKRAVEMLRSDKLNNKRLLSKPTLVIRNSSQIKRVKKVKEIK